MRRLGILLALLLGLTVTPAFAAVPTERTVTDPAEPGMAWDIRSVTLRAADGRFAKVVVRHSRRVAAGDGIDLWFDTNDDRVPDIYVTGVGFSEYAVFKARGWTGHGRDISDRGCAALRMVGRRSVVRIDPSCLAPSARYSVSVRSSVHQEPASTVDFAPGEHQLTRKVRSSLPGQ
ncbi:hypothetical protein [Nocardioides sp. SR21]|uniref:hypothetical protein n=1 Tax=Nocardioides sp. SR21 TaxID=2919501 RepID=UPI001FAA95E6|nr:hypothetical protein [Nocardioides sp. SR21]